jgi:hypothetical protein
MQLLGTGKQRSSKTSRITVQNLPLTFASWDITVRGDDLETTNFESYFLADNATYSEGILGILSADVRFGGDWDAGTNPYTDPPGLYPRDDLPNVLMYESRLDNVGWNFPYVRIRGSTNGAKIKDKIVFDASGNNQGRFLFPAGSV